MTGVGVLDARHSDEAYAVPPASVFRDGGAARAAWLVGELSSMMADELVPHGTDGCPRT